MNQDPVSDYIETFNGLIDHLPGGDIDWLKRSRRQAIERFAKTGFPLRHDEAWKYTNVTSIIGQIFTPADAERSQLSEQQIVPFLIPGLETHRLVFVDGHFEADLSSFPRAGAQVSTLALQLKENPEAVKPYLADPDESGKGFQALNAAYIADGAFVQIPAGMQMEQPIHLLFIASGGETPVMANSRNLILAGKESRVTLIEHYVGLGEGRYLNNMVTEVIAAEGATVEHYSLLQEGRRGFHIEARKVRQERNSRYHACSIALGSALARNEISVRQEAEGAETRLQGLCFLSGRQHLDNHIQVDHTRPGGISDQFYKGVLSDAARSVFSSRVVVHPGAQATDAHQLTKNLLLSDQAEVDARPQLEIHADDVKCSHGAAVGQLNEDALFYLRSRGIDEAESRHLLVQAFLGEVLERISLDSLREAIEKLLQRLVRGDNDDA